MKKTLILLLITILISCNESKKSLKQIIEFTTEVSYNNGDKDTLKYDIICDLVHDAYNYLHFSENGNSCLKVRVYGEFNEKIQACYVRSFKVLKKEIKIIK